MVVDDFFPYIAINPEWFNYLLFFVGSALIGLVV